MEEKKFSIRELAFTGWEGDVERLAEILYHQKDCPNRLSDAMLRCLFFAAGDKLNRLRMWQKFASRCRCWGGCCNHTPPTPQAEIDFFVKMYWLFDDLIKECNDR